MLQLPELLVIIVDSSETAMTEANKTYMYSCMPTRSSVQVVIDHKELENVEYFSSSGC